MRRGPTRSTCASAPLALPQHVSGRPVEIGARVVSDARPDSVTVWLRPLGAGWFRPFTMRPVSAYEYRATIPADSLPEGEYKYVISVRSGDSAMTFPDRIARAPWDWDFQTETFWRTSVVRAGRAAAVAVAGGGRRRSSRSRGSATPSVRASSRSIPSAATGEPAIRLTLPVNVGGLSPEDYTASLVIKDRIASRGEAIARATGVRLKLRGVGPRQRLHVTLMEKDGTSWSTAVALDSTWAERTIPLSEFRAARGVKLPLGYPGTLELLGGAGIRAWRDGRQASRSGRRAPPALAATRGGCHRRGGTLRCDRRVCHFGLSVKRVERLASRFKSSNCRITPKTARISPNPLPAQMTLPAQDKRRVFLLVRCGFPCAWSDSRNSRFFG